MGKGFIGPNPGDELRPQPDNIWGTPLSTDLTYIGPSMVDIEWTLAATKAADIGFKITITGEPTDEQREKAVAAAEATMKDMLMARRRAIKMRDEPAPEGE